MRRLYLQIYVAFVVVLLIFLVLVTVAWAFMPTDAWQQRLESAGAVIGELIIPPTQSPQPPSFGGGRLLYSGGASRFRIVCA